MSEETVTDNEAFAELDAKREAYADELREAIKLISKDKHASLLDILEPLIMRIAVHNVLSDYNQDFKIKVAEYLDI